MKDLFDEKILKNYEKDIHFSFLNNFEKHGIEIYYFGENTKSYFNYYSDRSFEKIIDYILEKYSFQKEKNYFTFDSESSILNIPNTIINLIFCCKYDDFIFFISGNFAYYKIDLINDEIFFKYKFKNSKSLNFNLKILDKYIIKRTEIYRCFIPNKITKNIINCSKNLRI